jgi:hypothetical protein
MLLATAAINGILRAADESNHISAREADELNPQKGQPVKRAERTERSMTLPTHKHTPPSTNYRWWLWWLWWWDTLGNLYYNTTQPHRRSASARPPARPSTTILNPRPPCDRFQVAYLLGCQGYCTLAWRDLCARPRARTRTVMQLSRESFAEPRIGDMGGGCFWFGPPTVLQGT